MLRKFLRPWVRAAGNQLRFPLREIGRSSYIDSHCRIAPGVVVGRDCHIFDACLEPGTRLGDEVIIGHRAKLARSKLGRGCLVEKEVELYDTTLGDSVSIQTKCVLNATQIGRLSYVARETYLNEVNIGSFVSVGPRSLLGTGTHPLDLVSTAPVFYSTRRQCGTSYARADHVVERLPITLGHDVWLGAHVFVGDGVTIADGAIVAAGSVVMKDVPPYAIVGGTPAKLIRPRFSAEIVARLLSLQWWHWDESRLRAAQPWFAQSDIVAFLRWAEA
jgi:chloramphenicol O-acetyltransferase type B